MHDRVTFEARFTAALERYADGALTEVDAVAYTRAIAAEGRDRVTFTGAVAHARRWLPWRSPARRLGLVLATTALIGALIGTALILGGRGYERTPVPSANPTAVPTSVPTAASSKPIALEDVYDEFLPDVTYTSKRFRPSLTFRLRGLGNAPEARNTDWCGPYTQTSGRAIVLAYKYGCLSDVRIIRPYAVDCGTPDAHPDAATLAAAMLANPGMTNAHDLGALGSDGVVPSNLFAGSYVGRVIRIDGRRTFDAGASDPDHCRLRREPGSTDPTIELRGDLRVLLILMDVDRELVVVRVGGGGYDAPTTAMAQARGYFLGDELAEVLVSRIYDVRIGSSSATSPAASSTPITSDGAFQP